MCKIPCPSQHLCAYNFCLNKIAKLRFLLLYTQLWGQDNVELSPLQPPPAPHCKKSWAAMGSWFPLRKDLVEGMAGFALSLGLPVLSNCQYEKAYSVNLGKVSLPMFLCPISFSTNAKQPLLNTVWGRCCHPCWLIGLLLSGKHTSLKCASLEHFWELYQRGGI